MTIKSVKSFVLNAWIQVSADSIEKKQLCENEILTNNENQSIGKSYSTKKILKFPNFGRDSGVQYRKL